MNKKEFLKQLYEIDPELAKMVGSLMVQQQPGLPDDRSISEIPKRELYEAVLRRGVVELNDHHKLVKCYNDSEAVCAIHKGTCTGPIMRPDYSIHTPNGPGLKPRKADPHCPYSPGTGNPKDLL